MSIQHLLSTHDEELGDQEWMEHSPHLQGQTDGETPEEWLGTSLAGVQPRLIQGVRSGDGVGEDQDTIASIRY